MAGRVVGDISLKATVDGPNPVDARLAGERAGAELGDGMDESWGKKVEESFAKLDKKFAVFGRGSGGSFNSAFGDELEKGLSKFDKRFTPIENGIGRISAGMDKFTGAVNRNRVAVENHGASMKRWQAITLAVTALILGAGNDMAALGSALGAGLVVLGGAAAATVVGVGVGIAAIAGLTRSLDKLPAGVRPAAKAFQDLKGVLTDLQTALTVSAFQDSEGTWRSLGATIKGLTPALQVVAKAFGQVTASFARGIAPGTKAFGQLDALIRGSAPIFTKLIGIVGKFGSALLAAFASSRTAQSINKLLDWLGNIGQAFEDFTSSPAFDHWLDKADSVFGGVGRLIDSLASTLSHLSTDAAVQSLNGLLDSVSGVLPVLGRLIDVGGALDPLGLIAQALDAITAAVDPLLGPLTDLAGSLNDILKIAIDQWGKDLKGAFDGIAPLLTAFADAIGKVDEQTIRDIADAVLALAGAFLVMKGAQGIAGLGAKVGDLATNMDKLSTKAKLLKGSTGGVAGALAGIVAAFSGGGPGVSAASGAAVGAQFGGLPGLLIGALAGAIASMFTDWPKWQNGLNQISDFFTTWWTNITSGGAIANGWTQITDAFGNGWEQIIAAFANGWNQISTWFTTITAGLLGWFASIVSGFISWGQGIIFSIAVWIAQVTTNWNSFWTNLFINVITWTSNIINTVVGWGAGIVSSIGSFIADALANWNSFWSGLWNTVVTWTANIIGTVAGFGGTIVANIQSALAGLTSWWNSFWDGLVSGVSDAWNTIISNVRGFVNTVVGLINGVLDKISALSGGLINLHVPSLPKTAVGGLFTSAQTRIIGEAGPEAVVPLRRNLSQVDPSVRGLSAFAQGKGVPESAGVRSGGNVIFEAGAIVSPYSDPALVATQAADKVAEMLAV